MTPLTPKEFLIAMIMGIIWGFVCMLVAKKKGRDPRSWFLLGLFFSLFAFLILLLVPSSKAMEAVALAKADVVQQERVKNEALQPFMSTLSKRVWFYLDQKHSQVGPVDFEELKKKRSNGDISSKTYLWSEGMQDWKTLDNLSYLKTELE